MKQGMLFILKNSPTGEPKLETREVQYEDLELLRQRHYMVPERDLMDGQRIIFVDHLARPHLVKSRDAGATECLAWEQLEQASVSEDRFPPLPVREEDPRAGLTADGHGVYPKVGGDAS